MFAFWGFFYSFIYLFLNVTFAPAHIGKRSRDLLHPTSCHKRSVAQLPRRVPFGNPCLPQAQIPSTSSFPRCAPRGCRTPSGRREAGRIPGPGLRLLPFLAARPRPFLLRLRPSVCGVKPPARAQPLSLFPREEVVPRCYSCHKSHKVLAPAFLSPKLELIAR